MKKGESRGRKRTATVKKIEKASKASNYVETKRAKKIRGKSVKVGGISVIKPKKKGQKEIAFKKGGLHAELGVAQDKKIPPSKMRAALSGKEGKLAKKEALFKKNVLTGRKKKK